MLCQTVYDELMSLKLDGQLDQNGERHFDEHLQSCSGCALLWAAMQQADSLIRASALEPLPVPSALHWKVMSQVATPALVLAANAANSDPIYNPATGKMGNMPASATRRLGEVPTGYLNNYNYAEWQRRVASSMRVVAATGIAIAGLAGLLLALAMSGTLKLSGPAADFAGVVRTLFEALGTWARSIFTNITPDVAAIAALLVGVLLLVGWQVVSAYQHTARENRGTTGVLEAA